MVISALVVTTAPSAVRRAYSALEADHRLTLGAPERNRIPVVAETVTTGAGRELYRELQDLDEVWAVDVVMVDFSQEEPTEFVEAPHGS